MMNQATELVITGMGVISPLGVGVEAYWQALVAGTSGVQIWPEFDREDMPVHLCAPVKDFDPKLYVRPRKSLKVMSHTVQMGVAAGVMAGEQAGYAENSFDPERLGVIYGVDLIQNDLEEVAVPYEATLVDGKFDHSRWSSHGIPNMYPLWMLKYLPNMPACHVGIAHDARGPCNTVTLGDVSSLMALEEAARTITSGRADAMIVGGASSRVHAWLALRASIDQQTPQRCNPEQASKPFDVRRDGMVNGEGAAAIVLETRQHAEARGAKILARLLGCGSAFEPQPRSGRRTGSAVARSIEKALGAAGVTRGDVGHVNAHGTSTTVGDAVEAQGIRSALGETPVVAYKSYFGNLGTGSGMVELVASILSLQHGLLPPTLNYEEPDPECPVNVVHGQAQQDLPPVFVKLSQSFTGQAAAAVLAAP